jgi:hypothetical protein
MNDNTILLRQVHPNFFQNEELSSQAFYPFPKDNGRLSVYDGGKIVAKNAYLHYTTQLKFQSVGVWGVSCQEVIGAGLNSLAAPLPNFSEHAEINFGNTNDKTRRKLAKLLRNKAVERGCLYKGEVTS